MAAKPGPTLPEVDAGHDAEFIDADDPVVVEATSAVQLGDLQSLDLLLADDPWLATSRFGDAGCHRTLLHAATDWPGNFPNGPTVVRRLVEAGADVNAHSKFDAHTVERGARTRLKDAAALGMMDRVESAFAASPAPTSTEATQALWSACRQAQEQAARYLLERGADINWIGWDDLTPLDAAEAAGATELTEELRRHGAVRAAELRA